MSYDNRRRDRSRSREREEGHAAYQGGVPMQQPVLPGLASFNPGMVRIFSR